MIVARWNGAEIARSDDTVVVEGNHYFPADAVAWDHLIATNSNTTCPWKGTASYYSVVVDGDTNADAAWVYPETTAQAEHLRGRIAFWRGVDVIDEASEAA